MSKIWCMECGRSQRAVEATGTDLDGDPGCPMHMVRPYVTSAVIDKKMAEFKTLKRELEKDSETKITVSKKSSAPIPTRAQDDLCFCGRPSHHRGRHRGVALAPTSAVSPVRRTKVDRSVTHREIVTVDHDPVKEIKQGRVQTILVPGAKPVHHVRLTPDLAEAVWDSLSMEEKFKIFDVDNMWLDYDDDMKMMLIGKVLLIYPDDIKPPQR